MAFRNASRVAIERGSTVVIVEIVFVRVFDDQFGRFAEQVGTSRMRGEDRSVAGQRKAERFGQAVHRIGREHS